MGKLNDWLRRPHAKAASARTAGRRSRPSRRARLMLETLEDRLVLSPTWIPQGPFPVDGGQVEGIQGSEVSGAVTVVVPAPRSIDPSGNILYVGTANGGVWRTNDAQDTSPVWMPETDQFPGLSIGDLDVDPTDPTGQTLVAGIGRTSDFNNDGGPRTGLLKTTNGGTTWTPLAGIPGPGKVLVAGLNIIGVAARGNTIVVAANFADTYDYAHVGIFRSTDGGTSFQQVSGAGGSGLPFGVTHGLTADPTNPSVLYTDVTFAKNSALGTVNNGIFKSTDAGATWSRVSNATIEAALGGQTNSAAIRNVQIAVGNNNNVFVGVVKQDVSSINRERLVNDVGLLGSGIFFSPNGGASWQQMELPETLEKTAVPYSNINLGIVTSANHRLATGDRVLIQGIGTFNITVIDQNRFSLNGGAPNSGGGNWQYLSPVVTGANDLTLSTGGPLPTGEPAPGTPNARMTGKGNFFSIAADPNNISIVYVGGDEQPRVRPGFNGTFPLSTPAGVYPNVVNASVSSGRLFRGNAAQLIGNQWTSLTDDPSLSGLNQSVGSPHSFSRSLVFDNLGNLVEGDSGGVYVRPNPQLNANWQSRNGNLQITEFHSIAYDAVTNTLVGGTVDVGVIQQPKGSTTWVDNTPLPPVGGGRPSDGGQVAVDDISQFAQGQSIRYESGPYLSNFTAQTVSLSGAVVRTQNLSALPGLQTFYAAETNRIQRFTPLVLNAVDPTHGLIATTHVYETTDGFQTLTDLTPSSLGSQVTALAYGGSLNLTANVGIIYAGLNAASNNLRVRSGGGGSFTPTNYTGGAPVAIVLNPNDYRNVFVTDGTDIYESFDSVNFVKVTGDLPGLAPGKLRSLTYIQGNAIAGLLVGTDEDVYATTSDELNAVSPSNPPQWFAFEPTLPGAQRLPHAPVQSLVYDATAHVLVAGTLGRGAWIVQNADQQFTRAPVVVNTPGFLTYTENDPPTLVDPDVTITDLDSTFLAGATVSFTQGFAGGQDVLAFTAPAGSNITGSYNAALGVLTLSGRDTLANYQLALQSVTYFNSSDNPSTADRTVTFTASDGTFSGSGSRTVQVSAVNDAPALVLSTQALSVAANTQPVPLDISALVTDPDSPTFSTGNLTVQILTGGQTGDSLSLKSQGTGTGQVNVSGTNVSFGGVVIGTRSGGSGAAPLVITFNTSSSVAAVQAVTRTVSFNATTASPNPRTIQFQVTDDQMAPSSPVSAQILVTAPPMIATTPGSASFVEKQGPVIIDPNISVSDQDSTQLTGASVAISQNYDRGQDVLAATLPSGMAGSFDPNSGVYSLSGNASVAAYQTALRSLTFNNSSTGPNTKPRTITFTVADDTSFGVGLRSVTVTSVNDPPVVTASLGVLSYTEKQAPAPIDPQLQLTDADNTTLVGVSVAITSGFVQGEDVLAFAPMPGIAGSFDPTTGILTFGGAASPAAYQAEVRSVTYFNASSNPSTTPRTITITADDGQSTGSATRQAFLMAVDDPPVESVPGQQVVTSGVPLVFSSTHNNALTVSDPDAGTNAVQVTLSVSGGTLTLGNTAGVNVISGEARGDVLLIFSGSLSDVNNALDGLAYTPPQGFQGQASLTFITDDLGNTGSGGPLSDTRTITLGSNAAPTNVTLSNASVVEHRPTGTLVGLLSTADADVGDAFTYTLVAGPGGDDNASFTVSNNALLTNASFVAAQKSLYSVRVRSTDRDGAFVDRIFTIAVLPQNQPTGGGGLGGTGTGPGSVPASTVGVFDPSTGNWFLRNSNNPGPPAGGPFAFGGVGWNAVVGDWDGNGTRTVGAVDTTGQISPFTVWYLRNTNSPGAPDYAPVVFGLAGWVPVAGDFNGDGVTDLGAFDPTTGIWYLRNGPGSSTSFLYAFPYGLPNWKPVVGDWNGDGIDSIGVFDPSTANWYLRNSNNPGLADVGPFGYGGVGWAPVAGDWNGDGVTTVGVIDPNGYWYIHNSNSPGAPDVLPFPYGLPNWHAVAGNYTQTHSLLAADAGPGAASLDAAALQSAVQATLTRLGQEGVDALTLQRLASARYAVANLSGTQLGEADRVGNRVLIDADAAGHGWFVDPTPSADEEFTVGAPGSPLVALPGSAAAGHDDLLTVLAHEMGHLAGQADLDAAGHSDDLMAGVLATGTRRLGALDSVFARGL